MKNDYTYSKKFQLRLSKREAEMLNKISESMKISKSDVVRGLIRKEFFENYSKK